MKYRFLEWNFTAEAYILACVLHDIGTTKYSLSTPKLSFEFHEGLITSDITQHEEASGVTKSEAIAPKDQAENVAEAVIRHQDLCEKAKMTPLGQLLQLAAIFDNLGLYESLVHASSIEVDCRHSLHLKWRG